MAKKKKHKKHNFNQAQAKAAQPATSTAAVAEAAADATSLIAAQPVAKPQVVRTAAEDKHLQQITSDVRRVIFLAASFVAAQVVLWVLFEHTSVGPAVYGLIHH